MLQAQTGGKLRMFKHTQEGTGRKMALVESTQVIGQRERFRVTGENCKRKETQEQGYMPEIEGLQHDEGLWAMEKRYRMVIHEGVLV